LEAGFETLGSSARHGFANLHGYAGVGQAGTGTGLLQGTHSKPIPMQWVQQVFSFSTYTSPVSYLPVSALEMSAANLLFTYLLFVGTNILILLRGKRCPEERGACGSSILYTD
jgi:hypothetical protein